MDQPRRSSRLRQGSHSDDKSYRRRSVLAHMMEENREGLGMKVIAVMVQRYGVLPKELWDLNSISDMGAGRGITYSDSLSKAEFKRIISNKRYDIINITIVKATRKVDLPDTLRRLEILARPYNFPLDLPSTLEEVMFEEFCVYNHPLVLPDNLRKLKLGRGYSHPLILPQRLQHLAFDYFSQFNHPLALPGSLLCILFGKAYDQPTVLPLGIEEIKMAKGFTHDLLLPNSVRNIDWRCARPIQIPEGVVEVKFFRPFDQPVVLPASLRKVSFCGSDYSHPLELPSCLEEFAWWIKGPHGPVLPEGLQKLTWGSTRDVRLPLGLKELYIIGNVPLVLPEGLLRITFGNSCTEHYNFPGSVEEVTFTFQLNEKNFTHPTTLQHLILRSFSVEEVDLSRHKIHKVTIAYSKIRIKQCPQGLKELEFTVDNLHYPLRVPQGCRIVGDKRPANLIME